MRMKHPLSKETALERAADLCSKSEYCEREMRDRLHRWGVDRADTEDIIEYLVDNRFIDETRYACAYVHDKYKYSYWGRRKIRIYLMHNRISAAAINKAMLEIDKEEYNRILYHQIELKSKTCDIKDYKQRLTVVRSLSAKGFEPMLINAIIDIFLSKQ